MNNYFIWFIIFFCIILPLFRERKQADVRKIQRKRRKQGNVTMDEIIKEFIDKEVVVYVSGSGSAAVTGFIRKAENGWIKLEKSNKQVEIISIDYVNRIQEYPRNKKGKKKMIFAE